MTILSATRCQSHYLQKVRVTKASLGVIAVGVAIILTLGSAPDGFNRIVSANRLASENDSNRVLYFPLLLNLVGSSELVGGVSPTIVATSNNTSTPNGSTPSPVSTLETPTYTPTPIPSVDPLPSRDGVPLCHLTVGGVSQVSGVTTYNWNGQWAENTALKTSKLPIVTGHPAALQFHLVIPINPQGVFMEIYKVTPENMVADDNPNSPWVYWIDVGGSSESEYIGNTRDISTALDRDPGLYVLYLTSFWNHPDSSGYINYAFFVDIR